MRTLQLISIILIIILFIVDIYFYTVLPSTIVTHWNYQGQADGSMSKLLGLFLLPVITLVLFLLFLAIPRIDPLKKNIKEFLSYYEFFILLFIIFMFYINILTILWNLGYASNKNLTIVPALGLFFIFIGFILRKVKRNFFIVIRTPWTLSSEVVWDKTHKLGSKLIILSGIITLIGIFFQNYMLWFILTPIIVSAIILLIYSYLEFRKEEKKK